MFERPAPNEFAAAVQEGDLLATPGVMERFKPSEIAAAMRRYLRLDWKDMDEEDQQENLRAAMTGEGRVLGAYRIRVTREQRPDLWIITEADRSSTTFLLPEEY